MPDPPPYTPGQHVRVTCTGHPRTGEVGVVVTVDWSEPTAKQKARAMVNGEPEPPGTWWVRVRIGPKATWDDWRTKGVIEDAWDLKADEVEGVGEGP